MTRVLEDDGAELCYESAKTGISIEGRYRFATPLE